jgi:phosphatidylglycerophosphate synthase
MLDGAYFHLYKYKLHTRKDSIVEHFTHTLRAATMAVSAVLLFAVNTGGRLLWLAFLLIAIDIAVETWDVLIEKQSRKSLGGLSSAEYLSHAHAILLYAAAYALVLAAKPSGAFAFDAPVVLPQAYPAFVTWLGWGVGLGAAASTIQHAVYLHPRYREGNSSARPAPEGQAR